MWICVHGSIYFTLRLRLREPLVRLAVWQLDPNVQVVVCPVNQSIGTADSQLRYSKVFDQVSRRPDQVRSVRRKSEIAGSCMLSDHNFKNKENTQQK